MTISVTIREWRVAVKAEPRHFPSVFALGVLLGHQGQYREAKPLLAKAATMRPDHADTQFELGRIAYREENYRDALVHLMAAGKLNPQSKNTSFLLARTLQRLGREREAQAEFRRSRGLYQEDMPDLLDRAFTSK